MEAMNPTPPENEYHKPSGHHTAIVNPKPVHEFTTRERFGLMLGICQTCFAVETECGVCGGKGFLIRPTPPVEEGETPLTDHHLKTGGGVMHGGVHPDFARALERRLASLQRVAEGQSTAIKALLAEHSKRARDLGKATLSAFDAWKGVQG